MKSDRDGFDKAMVILSLMDVGTARLDRYYSNPVYVDMLGGKVYIIPKRNSALKGSQKWKDAMKEFVQNTVEYGGTSRAVPSEEQCGSRLCCLQEDAQTGNSAEAR